MADNVRYAKTEKGVDEISQRRNTLRGKMRTMLILVDPGKTGDELRQQGARIGVQPDFLEILVREGHVAAIGPGAAATMAAITGAPAAVTGDELTRFREAKAFMNDTVVGALGIRAFMFTLRLERCATRAELAGLVPDYEKALRKGAPEEAPVLIDRLRELLG